MRSGAILAAIMIILFATEARAEPITLAVFNAFVLVGLQVSMATAAAIASVLTTMAITALSMAVSSLMLRKPAMGGESSSLKRNGHLINGMSTTDPIPVVYGKCRVGGTRVFIHAGGPSYGRLNVVIVWSEGPCQGLDTDSSGDIIYYDDKRMQYYEAFHGTDLSDHVFHSGTVAQTVDTMMNDATYGNTNWDDLMRWTCYSAFRLTYNQDAWNQLPTFTALLKGRLLYDPRDGTTQWGSGGTPQSQNPALVWLDFMTSKRYGMGIPYELIDMTSVITAANWCDAQTPAYQFNGIILDRKEFSENIQDILNSFRAYMIWSAGKYYLKIYSYDTSVMTLTEADTDTFPDKFRIESPGIPETPNQILVSFRDPNDNYVSKQLVVMETASITTDGEPRQTEIVLVGAADYELASHLGAFHLKRARYNRTFNVSCHPRTLALECGDMIQMTHTFPGWTNQQLRVRSFSVPSGGNIPITFVEESSSIYDMSGIQVATHSAYQSTLPDTHEPITEPTGLTATTGPDEQTSNAYDAYINFEWDNMGSGYNYGIRWRYSDSDTWHKQIVEIPYGEFDSPSWLTSYPTGYWVKSTGDYTGIYDTEFYVEIDGTGTPNTFKWSADYGDIIQAYEVEITGGWQTLSDGLKIKFSNTTGWTLGQTFVVGATGTGENISVRVGGLKGGKLVYWNVRITDPNSRERSDWATADEAITTWSPVVPSMAGYYPTVSTAKQGKRLRVDWSGWDGYGDRVKGALLYAGASYTDYSTEANNDASNDVFFMAASPAVGDAFYYVSQYPFTRIRHNIGTSGKGTWTLAWEYNNGAWTALSNVLDGSSSYTVSGETTVTWAYPADWAETTVDTVTGYAIRVRVTSFTSMSRRPCGKKIRIENSAVKDYDVFCSTQAPCPITDDYIVGHNLKFSPFDFPWTPGTTYDIRVRPNGWSMPGVASDSHDIYPESVGHYQSSTQPFTGTLYVDSPTTRFRSSRPRLT